MRNKIILTIQIFCLLLWQPIQAEDSKTVLLINSDSSVDVYSSSQKGFLNAYEGKVDSIDLNDKKWNSINKLKSTLYDIYPDVVYCIGTKAYLLANKFLPEKSIVFSSTVSYQNLPKNENTVGISSRLHPGMELMTLKMFFPEIKEIGVIYSNKYHRNWMKTAQENAIKMNMKLKKIKCDSVRGMTAAELKKLDRVDALWLTPDPGAFQNSKTLKMVLDYCLLKKIPVFSYSPKLFVHDSVVISVSVDTETIGRQSAIIVNDIMNGKSPRCKLCYSAGTVITVNRKRADSMGLKIDENAMSSANKIIE